jgi:2,4-diaminopentanoate dehydrogenase
VSASLRVVQWATGNIGTRSLRAIIEHPGMELVGLLVHDPDKVGRDAGDLCGIGPVGVVATADRDEILALSADCALHMPRAFDLDDVCVLLAGGTNVVTTCGALHHPATLDQAMRERLERACDDGQTSVHATGSSPGFITEAVPLVLTSIQRRLDRLTIDEFADMSSRDSPDLLFGIMGFGRPPAEFDEGRAGHLRDAFGPSLRQLADALSLPLDDVEAHGELALATKNLEIAAGSIEAGTVAGMRTVVVGMREGRELIRFRANWYCSTELDGGWALQPTGWRVQVEGDTPLDVTLRFPVSPEQMAETTPGYTAHRAVNAVGAVCEASPGIRTTADLPQLIAQLS